MTATPNSRSPRTSPSCAAPRMSRSCSRRRSGSACRRSASPTATRWRAWCARIARRGNRHSPGRRLPARPDATAPSLLVYPTDRPAYSPALPPADARQRPRRQGQMRSRLEGSGGAGEGLIAILLPATADDALARASRRLRARFRRPRLPRADPAPPAERCGAAARPRRPAPAAARVPTVATGDVLYHAPRPAHPAGRADLHPRGLHHRRGRLPPRALRRPPPAAARGNGAACSPAIPDALARTLEIAERCRFSLDELRYQYPHEADTPGLTPQQTLEQLTWDGAAAALSRRRAGRRSTRQLRHELALIARARLRALFPHRAHHRPFARSHGHPLPGPRLGGQFGRLLRARHHLASTRCAAACCSSVSSPPSARNRPTSTSISSTSGARK